MKRSLASSNVYLYNEVIVISLLIITHLTCRPQALLEVGAFQDSFKLLSMEENISRLLIMIDSKNVSSNYVAKTFARLPHGKGSFNETIS